MELMVRTNGVDGPHQWCYGLNTLQKLTGPRVISSLKQDDLRILKSSTSKV